MKSQAIQVEKNSESETAKIKMLEHNNVQVSVLDLLAEEKEPTEYLSGKIVYCLDGEMSLTLDDSDSMIISKGMLLVMPEKILSTRIDILTGVKLLVINQPIKHKKRERNPWRM